MSTQPVSTAPRGGTPLLLTRWAVRILLVAWAAFWTWFMVASGIGEGPEGRFHFLQAIFIVGPFVLAWIFPRVGGVLLFMVGIAAAVMFNHTFVRLTMALPALVCGIGLFLTAAPRPRRRHGS